MSKITIMDLKRLSLFSSLKEETLIKLCDIGNKKQFKKGEHIFRDKEKINSIYVVLKGNVALYKLNEYAQKKVIFILGENKIINEVILDDSSSSINCELFDNGEVLIFDKDNFIEVMKIDFQLTQNVINSLAKKVRRLYRQIKNSTHIKIEKKVAAKLWKLSKDYGIETPQGTLINLDISITYLADMFGAPRETISRAMKILQENELIIYKNKKIIICNRNKLSDYFKGL